MGRTPRTPSSTLGSSKHLSVSVDGVHVVSYYATRTCSGHVQPRNPPATPSASPGSRRPGRQVPGAQRLPPSAAGPLAAALPTPPAPGRHRHRRGRQYRDGVRRSDCSWDSGGHRWHLDPVGHPRSGQPHHHRLGHGPRRQLRRSPPALRPSSWSAPRRTRRRSPGALRPPATPGGPTRTRSRTSPRLTFSGSSRGERRRHPVRWRYHRLASTMASCSSWARATSALGALDHTLPG